MTTSMCAQPISASEPDPYERDLKAAKAAGWRKVDLDWERLQEAGLAAWRAGDEATAIAKWRKARRLAFWRFRRRDPRYATSLANAAMAARLHGNETKAHALYTQALVIWRRVPAQIETLELARRARSSMFHLRMEARHWDTFLANQRKRIAGFVADAHAALDALKDGRQPDCRLYERWKGEKPPVFDDYRKMLAAALLIAAPISQAMAS